MLKVLVHLIHDQHLAGLCKRSEMLDSFGRINDLERHRPMLLGAHVLVKPSAARTGTMTGVGRRRFMSTLLATAAT